MALPLTEPPHEGSTVSITTDSTESTRRFAAALAGQAQAGDRIALIGPLGAGKTQFAKGFAVGLGITAVVNSPSFTLMAEYAGRLRLFHQDLYRLDDGSAAFDGGLLDRRQDEGVTLTEWADRVDASLDPGRLEIQVTILDDERRRFELRPGLPEHERYLTAASAWASASSARRASDGAAEDSGGVGSDRLTATQERTR